MIQAPMISHAGSPLEQANRSARVALADSRAQLSQRDQAALKQVLHGKYEYVDNDLFHKPQAEKVIFDQAPPIQRPDTSWYHPVMDHGSSPRALDTNKSVGTVLLTAAEERALFLQFNYCRFRVVELKNQIGQGPVKRGPAKELLSWHRKAEAYRDQIAQTNLALVLAMAKRTRMSEIDFSDLVSEGNMALLRAVDKFDVARGFKFSTYGCRAILKAFSRSGIKLSKYRQMFPTDFDPKLEKSDFAERKREDEAGACADEIRTILQNNQAELTPIEQEVILHRFAVGVAEPTPKPLTLEQVGKIIGVTKERVRQIQNKALEKIRQTLEDSYLA
ncbi:MAG: sigma-70 family RNA polymerase sigma factor [Phycisphaeraceae bacterium]|nr:sigma-70 family RNA polymerase sigma factor [Phycisphaeraceae bacterium]